MKNTKRAVKPATKAADVPEWVTETPEETEFRLEVWDPGTALQIVELSRVEYVALKAHLAKLRGISVPKGCLVDPRILV